MFLSRVQIDTDDRSKISEIRSLVHIHGWVEQCFPREFEADICSRKLWRIDFLRGKKYLLIVSETEPDFVILERYGVKGTACSKPYMPFINSLKEGQRARFRVTLNPVISIKSNKEYSKRGKVVPHVTVEQQRQFLLNRADANGFILHEDDFTVVERSYIPFEKSGNRYLKLSRASYEGVLTIKDIEVFKNTLLKGFGKKKAYGFGMMTVIPIK